MKLFNIILILIIISTAACGQTNRNVNEQQDVNVAGYKQVLRDQKKHQLIDVRTPKEYAEGHIEGSKNIDYFNQSFKTEIAKLDKQVPVYVYCRSGGRSGKSALIMKEMGFKEIYNLKGGYLAWEQDKK